MCLCDVILYQKLQHQVVYKNIFAFRFSFGFVLYAIDN